MIWLPSCKLCCAAHRVLVVQINQPNDFVTSPTTQRRRHHTTGRQHQHFQTDHNKKPITPSCSDNKCFVSTSLQTQRQTTKPYNPLRLLTTPTPNTLHAFKRGLVPKHVWHTPTNTHVPLATFAQGRLVTSCVPQTVQ